MRHESPAGLGGGGGDWRVAVELQESCSRVAGELQ
jgi:hypothetical protein